MLSSPAYSALCTKYRALIAEMQKMKRPILCYSELRANALVRKTITDYDEWIFRSAFGGQGFSSENSEQGSAANHYSLLA